MKRSKLPLIIILAIIVAAVAIIFVLKSEYALLAHPKGIIAKNELKLIGTSYLLMLIIVIPTFIFLFITALRFRKGSKAKYDPEHSHGKFGEVILWIIPSIIIAPLAVITWYAAHDLDPYKPLTSEIKPLTIQVVALDWKWLFIYPEQGIATLNYFQIPERTPINLRLSADGSPMNSFWLPELSGQIYAMTGMTTQLHIMADEVGEYTGRAAEINGEGFASMTFVAKSTSESDFLNWVSWVKKSPLKLNSSTYDKLVLPSQNNPIAYSSYVENNLFNKIIDKYMHHE